MVSQWQYQILLSTSYRKTKFLKVTHVYFQLIVIENIEAMAKLKVGWQEEILQVLRLGNKMQQDNVVKTEYIKETVLFTFYNS